MVNGDEGSMQTDLAVRLRRRNCLLVKVGDFLKGFRLLTQSGAAHLYLVDLKGEELHPLGELLAATYASTTKVSPR